VHTLTESRWVSISVRIYRRLLPVYSPAFKSRYADEMTQVFADLCADAVCRAGIGGLAGLWSRAFPDLIATALVERIKTMTRKLTPSTLAGIVLLVPTLAFLFVMFTRFVLGIEGLYDAWDAFYTNPDYRTANWLLERFVVLAPFAALALAALPVTRIQLAREHGELAASVRVSASAVTTVVILVSLLVIAVIGAYGFVENFRPV
jgi:hypothetical protein